MYYSKRQQASGDELQVCSANCPIGVASIRCHLHVLHLSSGCRQGINEAGDDLYQHIGLCYYWRSKGSIYVRHTPKAT